MGLFSRHGRRLRTGALSLPLPSTRELRMIAVADLARFV